MCNNLLEGVGASSVLAIGTKERFRGEALFVRLLVYFYLVNLFGDVPYIIEINYKEINRTTIFSD